MQILKTINKVPGGLMVVPLFIGMVINTFFPNLLKIGGFTEALSSVGYPTDPRDVPVHRRHQDDAARRAAHAEARLRHHGRQGRHGHAIAVTVAQSVRRQYLGFSTLAMLVAMSDTNGGMFMALTSVMGDKEDVGTYVPQSIETGPFLTMIILVGAGLANIPWLTMLSVIAPIMAGAVLGNLDKDLREFFGSHQPIIVPFMAFTLGQTINLSAVVTAGLPGVALGVVVLVVTGTVCILADLLLGGSGIAGAAASSTAGNSAAVPRAIAMADPTYAGIAAAATVQVAASVIVTAVLTPILTSIVYQAGAAAPRGGSGARRSGTCRSTCRANACPAGGHGTGARPIGPRKQTSIAAEHLSRP